MSRQALVAILTALFTSVVQANSTPADAPDKAVQVLYPAAPQNAQKGAPEHFTGEVRVDRLFPANDTAHYSGAYVTFQPGARSAWHMHPAGQHIVVTQGVALSGTRDGKIFRAETGDSLWCPPGVEHWHGATPDAAMTHLVITGVRDGRNVVWQEHVTDAQYRGQP
ncbi:MAG: cupin domain-containing protein [Steroidobacteraceae bacterium]|nr:cupin domain-containing protein [Nevskiaceae bacterium]MCP5339313.1 cupin domain-containing protein [Nevskiaceae bacterium]MCP5471406.1 cupin domain-containing protein [Nevskiaceae bacterium]